MKKIESIKSDLFGKEKTLDLKSMNAIFAGGATKTKSSKTKYSGNGDADAHESDTGFEEEQDAEEGFE